MRQLLKPSDDIVSAAEYYFAKKKKQYDAEGNRINDFTTPRQAEEYYAFMQWFNSRMHKKMQCKSRMKDRIMKRCFTMEQIAFCTFTINDSAMEVKNLSLKLARELKKVNITNYCLIADYGKENQRLHFHGFVDLKGADMGQFTKAPTKKHPNGLKIAKMTNSFGFNLITPLNCDTRDLKKTIGYCLKYATKDIANTDDFCHYMVASRSAKNSKTVQDCWLPF